jgi:hypothetical protein
MRADRETFKFYSEFVVKFLEKIYEETDYFPDKMIQNSLRSLMNDELAYKIRPRIINYLDMTKKIEDIEGDRMEGINLMIKKRPK